MVPGERADRGARSRGEVELDDIVACDTGDEYVVVEPTKKGQYPPKPPVPLLPVPPIGRRELRRGGGEVKVR